MRRPRRNHSANAELSEQFEVHASPITEWNNQLLKQAEGVFLTTGERKAAESGPSSKDLQAKIGQLAMENDFLKARSDGFTGRAQSDNQS